MDNFTFFAPTYFDKMFEKLLHLEWALRTKLENM